MTSNGKTIDPHLKRNGGLVWGEEGVPDQLSLQLFSIFTMNKLKYRLMNHVRLKTQIIIMKHSRSDCLYFSEYSTMNVYIIAQMEMDSRKKFPIELSFSS